MHIVIPCQKFDIGKSRLAICLSTSARRSLCEELFRRTIVLACSIVEPCNIFVTTSDPDAARITKANGAQLVRDLGDGLNQSLTEARRALLAANRNVETLMVLPTDLPFLCSDVLERACDLPAHVAIAPDESGIGTNLLILKGNAVEEMTFAFGEDSCYVHLRHARRLGFSTQVFKDWRAALDIDGPSQFSQFLAYDGAPVGRIPSQLSPKMI